MRDAVASNSEGAGASKVIFEGEVEDQRVLTGTIRPPSNAMSMTGNGSHRVVTILVLRSYRGLHDSRVTVVTGMGLGDCGVDFETGKQYLVYGDTLEDGSLFTSICTGTAPIQQSGVALRLLRGEPPLADDLLDPQSYYQKYGAQWTSKACGRVTKPDGSPLVNAEVEMSQVRDEQLPPIIESDPNLTRPDGSFCVEGLSSGKYLLTAEDYDYHAGNRWMGYYPGVTRHSDATAIEIKAGVNLSDLQFGVQKQPLYTVRFRIVTADGSPVPWKNLGVAVESLDWDPLGYREDHGVNEDGSYTLGLIPPGHYIVRSFIQPDVETGQITMEASQWEMAKQKAEISRDGEVVLKLALRAAQ